MSLLPALTEPAPAYDNFGCGYRPVRLNLRRRLQVGFGYVSVSCDGEPIWTGDTGRLSAQWAERKAAADPEHDWRIEWYGPLRGETYQRHGPREWNLVLVNDGFA